jgi:hypothetical protein
MLEQVKVCSIDQRIDAEHEGVSKKEAGWEK